MLNKYYKRCVECKLSFDDRLVDGFLWFFALLFVVKWIRDGMIAFFAFVVVCDELVDVEMEIFLFVEMDMLA